MACDIKVLSRGTRGSGWTDRGPRERALLAAAALALLAAALSGCAGMSDQTATLVAPGKFDFYNCQDIERYAETTRKRQTELEQLMARSAQGPGGAFVNAIAYRTEYLQARGELDLLAKTAAEKQCATQSQWSSARALF
jgi:hypothetical protein